MWIKSLLIVLVSLPALGFEMTSDFKNGFYWQALPIKMSISDSDDNRKNTLKTLAEDAMGEWESRTNLDMWELADGSSNVIRWSSNFAKETGMDPISVLAVAIRYTNGPYFAKTEIVINGSHPLNSDLHNLLTTITHELGHTMGLDHSRNMNAVMAPSLQDPYRGLDGDDISGMESVVTQTQGRQSTGYVSPLSYEEKKQSNGMSCGTVATKSPQGVGPMFSLVLGLVISTLRKIWKKLFGQFLNK
jgi:Matrixin